MRAAFDGRDAYVYVLAKHQSTEDPLMAFRSKPVELSDLLDVEPELAALLGGLLLRFGFLLDDLSKAGDATLRARPLTRRAGSP
ncbi:MAG: hypothetical protein ACT4RN_15245 [Pseudonocardia sp.]